MGSTSEALWNYQIEYKVRKLSSKQKAVLRCFNQDWKIDLKSSGVPLDKVIEIRARRNIWVHNKGVINQQYIDMVGGDTSHKRERVAKITYKYLAESEATLNKLAVYIHKVAHEKYYAVSGCS